MDRRMYFMDGERVTYLPEHRYKEEADLQKLIADNPCLVARAWDDEEHQVFLINREQKSQAAEDEGNFFSLDHLLVDDEGVPILVEVKRCSDTRIRREVMAQMLDYACRASSWSVDDLKEMFSRNNAEPYAECINDAFWNQVASNLKSERLRLVFAADEIPETLRILIKFLDRNMSKSNIEVYGVEIRQFKSGDTTMISTNTIKNKKNKSESHVIALKPSPRIWMRDEFIDQLDQKELSGLKSCVNDIMDYCIEECGVEWRSANAWKYLSYRAMCNGQLLFKIEIAHKNKPGNYCAAMFDTRELSRYLGEDWDPERIRQTILSFSSVSWGKERDLIWGDTKQYLYVDLRALQNESCVEVFKNTLLMLANEMKSQREQ